ncbi:hypothetical protein BG011_000572 [Mortierella polycephala]|uniref:Uncharacterized protein n=1 Tax=Mortierella polycephala TaxID=41804 RepID=A0A9P6QB82_9FUNG|nr:hypothetical protein BG011_000572 [Mortierella polycephala]
MLGRDSSPAPKANTRHSFHVASSSTGSISLNSSSAIISRTKSLSRRKMLTLQSSTKDSPTGPAQQSFPQQQPTTQSNLRRRSTSTISTAKLSTLPESVLAKEKEFMANTRILAMSNLIDTFTTSSHTKQGFYGKQLQIIGSTTFPPSPSSSSPGAELDLTVKIHIIENTWTTCALLPPSTILRRWDATYLGASSPTDHELTQEDIAELTSIKDDKDASWVQATADKTETLSPASSPTYEQRRGRPLSTSSVSSFAGQAVTAETHVAVLQNALSFVANKAGDYLVRLSIHVPLVTGPGSHGIHLSHIPKCRRNFIKFKLLSQGSETETDAGSKPKNVQDTSNDKNSYANVNDPLKDGFEFNMHPKIMSLDEAHLDPDSDEDAQFWFEVQEHLVGRSELVGKLVSAGENANTTTEDQKDSGDVADANDTPRGYEIAGCFVASSSLHVSWMSQETMGFIQEVEQDMTIHITGLPDQTKSSSLLQHRRSKDPEDSHALDHADLDEEMIEYEHLEMDDGDLVIVADDVLVVNVEKLGWKQPFMDFTVCLMDTEQSFTNDLSSIEITGEAVQDWEVIHTEEPGRDLSDGPEQAESETTPESVDKTVPQSYRVYFFAGTEGNTAVNIRFRVGQIVSVGYGKDITCHIPKVHVHGASEDKGQIHVHTSNDLAVQRCNTHLLESCPTDKQLLLDETLATRHQAVQHYRYQSSEYRLSVVAHRCQTLARIARIERVRAEIGVGAQQQPGFARVVLTNVVLPQQDDPYLRLFELDGAEIWSVLVNGKQCSKSLQYTDRKSTMQRTVLIPIPDDSLGDNEDDSAHQVEISYGFNTFDHVPDTEWGDEAPPTCMKLIIPGFNLPVGEYLVVASLPKLARDMEYDEPAGEFEVVSCQGLAGQRKTITYGAYMTLGRPQLSIRTVKIAPRIAMAQDMAFASMTSGPLEQISRTHMHGMAVVHDPQQPPFQAGPVIVQASSQRHPQQPLEPQNPQAERTLDGGLLSVYGTEDGGVAMTVGQSSNLSPQAGTPKGVAFRTFDGFSLSTLTFGHACRAARLWWKQVMAPVVALGLVIMIINVAAFQNTRTTSLDLVGMPMWRRPFAVIEQLWQGSGTRARPIIQTSELDGATDSEPFVVPDTMFTMAPDKAAPQETHDMEVRTPATENQDEMQGDDGGEKGKGGGDEETTKEQHGIEKLIRLLKDMVHGLSTSR